MMRRLPWMVALALLLLLPVRTIQPTAQAYVLHGYHLLEMMTRELGRARSLQVTQKLVITDLSNPYQPIELRETLSYVFPDEFRSESVSAAGSRIHVSSRGRYLTVLDGRIVSDKESELDLYKDLFLYNSRELLKNRLLRLGVAPDVSSLGRFQGRTAYVVGAQYPDESVPQLWLDKETFRPLRWLIRPAAANSVTPALEVRYFGWQKVESLWYPERIEFYEGDRLLRTIRVENLKVNPALAERMFDIAYLKSLYPYGDRLQTEQRESGGKSEVQKTIERFRKLFE